MLFCQSHFWIALGHAWSMSLWLSWNSHYRLRVGAFRLSVHGCYLSVTYILLTILISNWHLLHPHCCTCYIFTHGCGLTPYWPSPPHYVGFMLNVLVLLCLFCPCSVSHKPLSNLKMGPSYYVGALLKRALQKQCCLYWHKIKILQYH